MAKAESKRPKRIPVGGPRNIMTVADKDPNYVYRWVNDVSGRIQRFQEGGYEIVTGSNEVGDNTVDRGSRLGSAITKSVGGLVTAVLMRIPKEWYDEDQAAKMAEVDALEATMQEQAREDRYGTLKISRKK